MRISDWSSDVCSSDMSPGGFRGYPQIASHVVGRISVDQLEQDATFALGQTEGDVDVGIANAELASAAMERKTEAPRTIADRKSTRLNSSHSCEYRMPSSA